MHLRLHLHHRSLGHQAVAPPEWWRRIGIDRLAAPLDQLIVTSELLVGASMIGVGAGLLAFAGVEWPWAMVAFGCAVMATAIAALLRV
jgi:hypothetical protein